MTSLARRKAAPKRLYEKLYCARGDMENRIKEQQLDLFADRTSTHEMRANQLRLYFSSFAYVLLDALRRLGTRGTDLARAQCGTLRLKPEAAEGGGAHPHHGASRVAVVPAGPRARGRVRPGAGESAPGAVVASVVMAPTTLVIAQR